MELLHLPQSWQCSHQIEDDNDEPSTNIIEKTFVYPTAESISRIQRPVWDSSPRRHEEQEGEDDYAWYYKHPERYIWRPRRRRLIKSSRQKDEQFKMLDFLLNISRGSWSDASISETQAETWSLLCSSTGSTKTSNITFPKN